MILRGVFWVGLVWLSLSHGPQLVIDAPATACSNAGACADPVADTSAQWRKLALTRLAAIRVELNTAIAARRHMP